MDWTALGGWHRMEGRRPHQWDQFQNEQIWGPGNHVFCGCFCFGVKLTVWVRQWRGGRWASLERSEQQRLNMVAIFHFPLPLIPSSTSDTHTYSSAPTRTYTSASKLIWDLTLSKKASIAAPIHLWVPVAYPHYIIYQFYFIYLFICLLPEDRGHELITIRSPGSRIVVIQRCSLFLINYQV